MTVAHTRKDYNGWAVRQSIHPPKNVSERWNGQTQNGSKIACSRIAIRTEKKVRHSIAVRFAVRLNRTVIQVSRGRGRGLRSSRPSPRSTAAVNDSLAVHSAGARAQAAQPARRLCGVALPVTVHESDLTFLPRAGSFCHSLPLHVRVPLPASDGSRHPNDGGACASQGLLHTAFASRAREKYRTY